MEQTRIAGILMPISSLPSAEGIGTFGKGAYEFVDFLKRSGMALWQVLPLVPTGYGDSPYQSCCADAMNAYFIDLEALSEQGLLTQEEIVSAEGICDERRVDYGMLFHAKNALLRKAFSAFDRNDEGFLAYLSKGEAYDYALFMTLKKKFGQKCWAEWESPYRKYDEQVLAGFAKEHEDEVLFWQFTQYVASKQWFALKEYANRNAVRIMGDIPLYVAYDSVEMWKYGEKLFQVDADGNPSSVAGVPPDAFSKDGQLWGNPLYDWEKMKQDGYAWWNRRIDRTFELFDMVRIDHFRGFDRYFAVPAKEKTAQNGVWMDGPKDALFRNKKGYAIVAEDLGIIDEGVVSLLKKTGYPGMKVLEFAFDGLPENSHKPCNTGKNSVCYTGTHDNMPLKQYIIDMDEKEYALFRRDLRSECTKMRLRIKTDTPEEMTEGIVELAFATKANTVIIPMCDVLALGGEARLNAPSTLGVANWSWRFVKEDFSEEVSQRLYTLAKKYKRA